jgi:hypothetical protein
MEFGEDHHGPSVSHGVIIAFVEDLFGVVVSLPRLIASTNLLCYVLLLSLLYYWVVVQVGRDEKMSHCLYFSSIL